MAFGQTAGPPASPRQVKQLLELLQHAGHTDFRDARGPMGFTQRQAGGKFTRDEAEALIERLQEAEPAASDDAVAAPTTPPAPRQTASQRALARIPTAQLAAELQRRGWIVVEP
jgi:hypothetical protein